MNIVRKLNSIFNRDTKIKLALLLLLIMFGSFLEIAALGVISPFLSLLMNPDMIESNAVLKWAYSIFPNMKMSVFLATLSFMLAAIYLFRGLYLIWVNRTQSRFVASRRVALSDRLLKNILGKGYSYLSHHNIAEMQRIVLTDVENLFNLITNLLLFISDLTMMVFIILFLAISSPVMTATVLAVSLVCVTIYTIAFRKQIKTAAERSRTKYIDMTKSVNQALGGIKDVKVLRRERFFQDVFKKNSDEYIVAYRNYQVLANLPRLFIETFFFSVAFILISGLIFAGQDIQSMLPMLSLFVLAAFRLLPAISRATSQVTNIAYYRPSTDAVYNNLFVAHKFDIKQQQEDYSPGTHEHPNASNGDIVVRNMTFAYADAPDDFVLQDVSLTIPPKKSVALVGPSGAGKTTLADIILGIQTPQKGYVRYQGYSIHHHFEDWAAHIGYIPQQIYLLDESILDNVAFGIAPEGIDMNHVWRALEQAQLAEFVRSLPNGLHTIVGDRGIRLSGGQRQRIGIARALYNDPEVLVLDEATSSLDDETEKAVMDAIQSFQGRKTIIIIAHRLSTIEHCDIIYRVEEKTVVKSENQH